MVDDKLPKLRLCANPLYINIFMQYKPVKYEKLQDVVDMAEQGDYLISSDDKWGIGRCPCTQMGGRIWAPNSRAGITFSESYMAMQK